MADAVKKDSGDATDEAGGAAGVRQREIRTCRACGTKFSVTNNNEFCPVCILRGAAGSESTLPEATDSASGSGQSSEEAEHASPVRRFENYEVILDKEGKPIELGRGAMGVTYKAIDVDLRIPVTLKVISEKYVGEESARLRFLREARTAARVRHTNVASVFRLGRSGQEYFYAMEFVEGETLNRLIRQSGRLDVKLALEITTQVAAGLAAVQRNNLVHRDIKPSNIMVSQEGGAVTAKIIDLGLAKMVPESQAETAISIPGSFAGTPEFASPEQFAGIPVDIRSDLYSLGVVLWEMLTGRVPFNGSVAEVMYQHLHRPAPVELLKEIPQPVIVLLDMLLQKDPAQRFQTPDELLNAMPTVAHSIQAKRAIKHQEVRMTFVGKPTSRQEKSATSRAAKRRIAVLPFDTLSQGKGNTYFADGVQDEILSNLAKVSQLKVISRTSVMTFRPGSNRDLRSIARNLRVANVVEGTVRKDVNRVRITVRLVDARTDLTIWSETYDRDLTDIFTIQSEVAQMIARKLTATISPVQKKWIEAKPTENLEAYDRYLRAKQLIAFADVNALFGYYERDLIDAIALLEQAIGLDPKFTLAYCACAKANAALCFRYDSTLARRALGDEAVKQALRLQPELPEVHLAYAYHLYGVYRDYQQARVQLAIARRGLPNDVEAIVAAAWIDRRQGNWEEAIQGFNEAISLDPRNIAPLVHLGSTLANLRRFAGTEEAYNRAIDLAPDHPMLKAQKALWLTRKTGNIAMLSSVIAALPRLAAEDPGVLSWRLTCALVDRDWQQATELISRMKGSEDLNFSYAGGPVSVDCYFILISRFQGKQQRGKNPDFAEIREKLSQKVQASPGNAGLLSCLAVVDALLGEKHKAIAEAKRAVEMLPISQDAVGGPGVLKNLAVVYTWIDELDLAFETLRSQTKVPNGIYYGDLKLHPYWDPLRKDSRFEKLLAELAPAE
jgi:serine/threonine protein kinase/Tfp pilus assembly protein PilF